MNSCPADHRVNPVAVGPETLWPYAAEHTSVRPDLPQRVVVEDDDAFLG
jgi:hypothetical protein